MKSLSLDWNCVIAVEQGDEQADFVRELVSLHRTAKCNLCLLATSASENLRGSRTLPGNYAQFQVRIDALGWGDLPVIPTPFTIGLSFIGSSFIVSDSFEAEICALWSVIAPTIDQDPRSYSPENDLDDETIKGKELAKWRNAWCDVHSAYSHMRAGRDIFVTTNTKDFQRNSSCLRSVGLKQIVTPEQAVQIVQIDTRS